MDILRMMRTYLAVRGEVSSGGWQSALCPFHSDNASSFGIHVETGVANCFVCGSFTLKVVMERAGVPLGIRAEVLQRLTGRTSEDLGQELVIPELPESDPILNELLLSRMFPINPEAVGTGFTQEVVSRYGVLLDPLNGRTVWPIRDRFGRLRALSGRDPNPDAKPKYKVYKKELQNIHPGYDPSNRNYLFGMEFVYPKIVAGKPVTLCIVEGYKAAAWLYMAGFPDVVALMGSKISPKQFTLLSILGGIEKVIWFLDNDRAGLIGTDKGCALSIRRFPTYVFPYKDEYSQPDDIPLDEVKQGMEEPWPFLEWSNRMRHRRSQSASLGMYGAPPKRRSSGMGSSNRLALPIKDGRIKRVRFIPAKVEQKLWDRYAERVVDVTHDYLLRKIHWSAYGISPDNAIYKNLRWKGPIDCTAGPDLNDPQPCVGCYLNNESFINSQGKQDRQASMVDMAGFSLVELTFFHAVPKTSDAGVSYMSWEPCTKDERTGRGSCVHCENNLDRVWGSRKFTEITPALYRQLFAFNDLIASKGICGCTIYSNSFHCESCDHMLVDLEDSNMDDMAAAEYRKDPKLCPECNHYGPITESIACDSFTEQGEEIHDCAGVECRSIWNTDIEISSVREGTGDNTKWKTTFAAGKSGPLPYAPPSVENWVDLWEKLKEPFDMQSMVRHLSVTEQMRHVGLEFNPFMVDPADEPSPNAPTITTPNSVDWNG